MGITVDQARSLVTLLESELSTRWGEVDRHSRYYQGEQPLKFASEEFRHYAADRYAGFADNWVQVVADSPVERLTAIGFQPAGADRADEETHRVWQVNALDADSQLGFLGAMISRRSFVLVWGDLDDESTPQVTFEDASSCVVAYEPGSRRKRRAALRRWQDGNLDVAVLYLPDEVWKFELRAQMSGPQKSPQLEAVDEQMKRWEPREIEGEPNPQPNPMGVVPVVELPNRPLLADDPISDVKGVVAMQDAINLLWAHLFTSSDYASLTQRIILGAERPMVPILNSDGEVVGTKPVDMEKFVKDRLLWITDPNASIAEWQSAQLDVYTNVIEVAVGHIAAQTRTPQHYLIGKMANLSGDALIAAETGLVKRVEEKQLWFGQALREVARLIALAQGDDRKARAISAGTVLWADAESRSQSQLADALLKLKQIGFPFEWIAARYGLTPPEVANVLAMKQRETEQDPMAELSRIMAQGAGPPEPAPPAEDEPAE